MSSPYDDDDGDNHRSSGPRQTPGGGWVPIPDPTTLTDAAIARSTDVFRREIHALRETLETRLNGSDADRQRIWERLHELPPLYETFTNHLRDETIQRDAQNREVVTQRIDDLDQARVLSLQKIIGDHEHLRENLHAETVALQNLIEQRLNAMDTATNLLAAGVRKFPSDLDRTSANIREVLSAEIAQVRAVMAEKFTAIDGRFGESKTAVDAAFAAAKEAVAEQNKSNTAAIAVSETNTKEQLASLSRVTDAGLGALTDKITDARDRLTVIESLTRGIEQAGGANREQRTEERAESHVLRSEASQTVIMVIMALSVIIATVSTVAFLLKKL